MPKTLRTNNGDSTQKRRLKIYLEKGNFKVPFRSNTVKEWAFSAGSKKRRDLKRLYKTI